MALTSIIGAHKHIQSSNSTTWVITHNLNTTAPVVDCWVDDNGSLSKIIPLSVVATSSIICTINFTVAKSGEAILI